MCSASFPMSHRTRHVVTSLAAVLPLSAQAHGMIKGVGAFYAGLLHPLIDPAHAMALLALGVLLGQRGLARGGMPLMALTAGLMGGAGLAGWGALPPVPGTVVALALLAGAAVALTLDRLPDSAVAALAAALGLAVALDSAPDGAVAGTRHAALAGSVVGAILLTATVAAVASRAQRLWARTGLRIAGAWVVAGGLLALVLALR